MLLLSKRRGGKKAVLFDAEGGSCKGNVDPIRSMQAWEKQCPSRKARDHGGVRPRERGKKAFA